MHYAWTQHRARELDKMTASSCVYIVGAIALALLTACNSAAVEEEIQATVRAQSANLQRRDPKNVANFAANGGSITYETSNFPGERASPLRAIARVNNRIRVSNIGSRAINAIKPRGFNQLGARWERCHLIADSLGGSGKDARNLFACVKFTNAPAMSHYEAKLRDYLKSNTQALVRYEVSVEYAGIDFDFPTVVRMQASVPNTKLFEVLLTNGPKGVPTFIEICSSGTLTKKKPVPGKVQKTNQWRERDC